MMTNLSYTSRDNWSGDTGRHDSRVHYRLYVGRDGSVTVICTQDFDYPDYDARRILSPEVYATEGAAELALVDLLPAVRQAEHELPASLDPDTRARMLAASVRAALDRK